MSDSYIKEVTDVQVLGRQYLTNSSINVNPKELPKYWTPDYINERINFIDNSRHRMFMKLLWMTGIRVSEGIGIRKQDIDFINYVITIRWLKQRKYYYRNIPLHPYLKDMLQMYCASMKAEDLLFPFSRQRAWQLVQKYLDGHPHQFRHSFAVNWLRNGADIITLSRMLGHSKIQTTMEYLKIVPLDQGKELMKVKFE